MRRRRRTVPGRSGRVERFRPGGSRWPEKIGKRMAALAFATVPCGGAARVPRKPGCGARWSVRLAPPWSPGRNGKQLSHRPFLLGQDALLGQQHIMARKQLVVPEGDARYSCALSSLRGRPGTREVVDTTTEKGLVRAEHGQPPRRRGRPASAGFRSTGRGKSRMPPTSLSAHGPTADDGTRQDRVRCTPRESIRARRPRVAAGDRTLAHKPACRVGDRRTCAR